MSFKKKKRLLSRKSISAFSKVFAILICIFFCRNNLAQAQDATKTSNDTLSNIGAYLHGNEPSKVQLPVETFEEYNQRMQWWRDAKYGMFIHWGLYSILGGEYQGKTTPRIAEWIQNTLRIPLKDYQKLVKEFNPQNFDPKVWVSLAKAAGMKYLVITAKHHDGFALFDSKVSDYDVMSTPYHKDIIKQLKDECHKQGIRFGVYYSHTIDWEHPQAYIGSSRRLLDRMNLVDYDPRQMNRSIYLKEKAFPQLRELLSNYGQIDVIWYDMGEGLTNNEVREFVKISRELQPNVIISSRLGENPRIEDLHRDMLFDYYTPSDNYYTGDTLKMSWEMAGTTNGSWGYRKDDKSWRSADFIVQSLISSISRGGNYLLNVGPDPSGHIPDEAAEQLRLAGEWIAKNKEAIYGTKGSPFPWNYDWGYVTQKPGKLFLHVISEKRSKIFVPGMRSKVKNAYILENHTPIKYKQEGEIVNIQLPEESSDKIGYVVALELNDMQADVDHKITQYKDNDIRLDRISGDYNHPARLISWDFYVQDPGTYQIELISNEKGAHEKPVWDGSDQIGSIQIGGKIIPVELKRDEERTNPTLFFYKSITSKVGKIDFEKAGTYTLHLKGFEIAPGKWTSGFALDRIRLKKVK